MINKLRKGDIVVVDFPSNQKHCIQSEHPAMVISNHLTLDTSMSLQVIPITSQKLEKRKLISHVYIPMGAGNLHNNSIALCENIITVDRDLVKKYLGKLPLEIVKQVDRATGLQLNLNRNYNIEFALKLVANIKELDILSQKCGKEAFDSGLKQNLINNLKDFCNVHNIDFNRLFEK